MKKSKTKKAKKYTTAANITTDSLRSLFKEFYDIRTPEQIAYDEHCKKFKQKLNEMLDEK